MFNKGVEPAGKIKYTTIYSENTLTMYQMR